MTQLEIKSDRAAQTARIRAALSLSALVRPVGSIDIEKSRAKKNLQDRHRADIEEKSRAILLDEPPVVTLQPARTIQDYWDRCQTEGFGFPDLIGYEPHLASYVGATASLRFIQLFGVAERPAVFVQGKDRILAITKEGEMLVPPSTWTIWRRH